MNIVKGAYKKSLLGSRDEDQVNKMVMKQEAIPEIRFKLDIFDHRKQVIEAERQLQRARLLNNGIPNPNHIEEFKVSLVCLFDDLKYMIIEKGISTDKNYIHLFNLTEQLEFFGKQFSINELLRIKNFLWACLHKLKLTNLLITNQEDDDEYIKRMLENEY